MNKADCRAAMRRRRLALPAQAQEEAAQAVLSHLRGFAPYAHARCVAAYMACRGELSLMPVMGDLLARGVALALPRCTAPGAMTFHRVTRLDRLVPGAYGLMEPSPGCAAVAPEAIDLMLVPGTAFDASGGRIGQGGGYYDRYLPQTRALRVGVCHGFALLARVDAQAHDARMDAVITPHGITLTDDHRRT